MDTITLTTTLTQTLPLALVALPSGNTGALIYSASIGEIVNGLLLASILALLVLQLWRSDRRRA